ncbi:transposase [Nostoc sphaeroides CCNUC1]|uniref:Transposase n=1 Tax=Nostoc sphaeroides CCNUC1 TaxID=2653204 RepID=A0A5P8W2Q7_9NOSO|nr:transposase [Nostoc sphaeroides CCNUC1]
MSILGDIRQLPLWVALMVLTTVEEEQAPQEARYLLERSRSVPQDYRRGYGDFAMRSFCLRHAART